jgi:PPOX class probable F420-dependent enzyme
VDHVNERLAAEPIIWFATTRPRATPVWFLSDDWTVTIFTTPVTHKQRDLARSPTVSLHLETAGDGTDVVLLDGSAVVVEGVRADALIGFVDKYRGRFGDGGYRAWADEFSVAIRVHVTRITAWGPAGSGVLSPDGAR